MSSAEIDVVCPGATRTCGIRSFASDDGAVRDLDSLHSMLSKEVNLSARLDVIGGTDREIHVGGGRDIGIERVHIDRATGTALRLRIAVGALDRLDANAAGHFDIRRRRS